MLEIRQRKKGKLGLTPLGIIILHDKFESCLNPSSKRSMVDLASYTVHAIPSVPNEHHIVRYKALRLQALQVAPECFSSTYERENAMSDEEWRARLHSSDKVTIAAVIRSSESETLSPQAEWVGTVTVLGPNFLRQHAAFSPPPTNIYIQQPGFEERVVKYYLFVGLWVHPSHRGKGVGKRLVGAGVDWVRRDAASGDNSAAGDKQVQVLLQVASENKLAVGLYRSMGFCPIETDKGGTETDIWMGIELG